MEIGDVGVIETARGDRGELGSQTLRVGESDDGSRGVVLRAEALRSEMVDETLGLPRRGLSRSMMGL